MREVQMDLFGDFEKNEQVGENPEYEAFVEKFKSKKTTDDCYTPPLIFDAVRDWACSKYGIDPDSIVRPFYPGGDYQRFQYPDGCVVLDNPPFSIISQICRFYLKKNIPFFLFAPSLTVFSASDLALEMNHIVPDAAITYENGAVVQTAFVTSFGGDIIAQTAPDLRKAIDRAKAASAPLNTLPRYEYPDYVLTAAMLQKLSKYDIDFSVHRSDAVFVRALDCQL